GSTTPGNSTRARTGTMMSASADTGGKLLPAGEASLFACGDPSLASAVSATARSILLQGDQHVAGSRAPADLAVAAGRQSQPAIKASLRQFEPVNDCRAPFGRQDSGAGDDKIAIFDRGLRVLRIDSGQGHQDENFGCGLEDVDRRLPDRKAGWCARRAKQLAMH